MKRGDTCNVLFDYLWIGSKRGFEYRLLDKVHLMQSVSRLNLLERWRKIKPSHNFDGAVFESSGLKYRPSTTERHLDKLNGAMHGQSEEKSQRWPLWERKWSNEIAACSIVVPMPKRLMNLNAFRPRWLPHWYIPLSPYDHVPNRLPKWQLQKATCCSRKWLTVNIRFSFIVRFGKNA
jgi:hypothetical protein